MNKKLLVLLFLLVTACASKPIVLYAQTVVESTTDSTSKVDSSGKTIVISPPPSAISPSAGGSSQDLCTVGISGAVQTQILGISTGETVTDQNCERLKISKTLYDFGMKVAAVSVLCQDRRVHDAMSMAGTPCPFDGKIGDDAKLEWKKPSGKKKIPPLIIPETKQDVQKRQWDTGKSVIGGALLVLLMFAAGG
tara:strand:- start:147 stop:728 length:582 start_codon:yes stop_codon:yes gene_type:complete